MAQKRNGSSDLLERLNTAVASLISDNRKLRRDIVKMTERAAATATNSEVQGQTEDLEAEDAGQIGDPLHVVAEIEMAAARDQRQRGSRKRTLAPVHRGAVIRAGRRRGAVRA
jgi:hypothetical protein